MNWRKSRHCDNGQCLEVASWRKSSHSSTSDCVEAAAFRKSSHSMNHGDCVEAASFRTARGCASNECVEAGNGPGVIAVRDTKKGGAGPVLTFTPDAWQAFTARLRDDPGRS